MIYLSNMINFIIKCFDIKNFICFPEESECKSSDYTRSLYY